MLAQARACWQWASFIASCNTGEEPVLRVNLDETSLKLHVPARPGLVFEPCPKRRRTLLRQGRGPDLKTRRAAVTLVAFACDDEEVQRILPQIFVVNEHVVTKADVAELADRCEGNVQIIRRKSAWVNAGFTATVVDTLADCLKEELRKRQVVLHMDTCPAHTHVDVLKACSRAGIFVHFVPASSTAWLQPLDVAIFSKFKGWVVREVERQRLASATGSLTRPQVLDIYRRGVVDVIQAQGWARAFEVTGLRGQDKLSSGLLSRLNASSPPMVSSELPSFADLQVIFPAGMDIPIEELFATALARTAVRGGSVLRLPQSARLPRQPSHL